MTATPRSAATPSSPPAARLASKGFKLTRKAIVLIVLVLALVVMYATSLRVFFDQQMQIAQAKALITEREASITKLQDEIKRWDDPEYVKAQARTRLGWVIPGEVGYRVIGPDGKLMGGGVEIDRTGDTPESLASWWQKLYGSMLVADSPTGKVEKPK